MTLSHTLNTQRGQSSYFFRLRVVPFILGEYRKTVTALDVVYALKRSGRTLYGFGA